MIYKYALRITESQVLWSRCVREPAYRGAVFHYLTTLS